MVNQNKESLRTQIIDSINKYVSGMRFAGNTEILNADIFDNAIMPVLDAAMKAGELLLHRATTPQKPVNETIVEWLDGTCAVLAEVHKQEATLSKRNVLRILYNLEENAIKALADAKALSPETANGPLGSLLAGETLPLKG